MVIGRILHGRNGNDEPSLQWRQDLLQRLTSICSGGYSDAHPKCFHLPDGDVRAPLAHCGGLKYILAHFLPCHRHWMRYVIQWSILCRNQEVRFRTDYILGKDCCLFQNISVRECRHNLYHYLVTGCLFRATLREHQRYLGTRTCLPLLPSRQPP